MSHTCTPANDNGGGEAGDHFPVSVERLYPLVQMLAKRTAHRLLAAANDNAAPVTTPLPTDSNTR